MSIIEKIERFSVTKEVSSEIKGCNHDFVVSSKAEMNPNDFSVRKLSSQATDSMGDWTQHPQKVLILVLLPLVLFRINLVLVVFCTNSRQAEPV